MRIGLRPLCRARGAAARALLLLALASGAAAGSRLETGDIVLAQPYSPPGARLFRVDPETLVWQVLVQGQGFGTEGLVLDSKGNVLLTGYRSVVRIDPETGLQSVVTEGGWLEEPTAMAIDAQDRVYVLNRLSPNVVRVDTWSGQQTLVASYTATLLENPKGIAIGADGDLFVTDDRNEFHYPVPYALGAVVRIDSETGAQTHAAYEGELRGPRAIAVDRNGTLLVADTGPTLFSSASFLRIDPEALTQTVLFRTHQIPDPVSMVFEADGRLLGVDSTLRDLFRVDPTTGQHSRLFIQGFTTIGPGAGLAVVPEARLAVPPDLLDFGEVVMGSRAELSVALRNAGGGYLDAIAHVAYLDPGFALAESAPFSIRAGHEVDVRVSFTPAAPGPAESSLVIESEDSDTPALVTLRGVGVRAVGIDVRPLVDRNAVWFLRRILVAILGAENFDVGEIDPASLAFGPGAAPALQTPRPVRRDVNGDGFTDLVVRFESSAAALEGDEACLRGALWDGSPFVGCDAVLTAPGPRP